MDNIDRGNLNYFLIDQLGLKVPRPIKKSKQSMVRCSRINRENNLEEKSLIPNDSMEEICSIMKGVE